MPFDPNLGFMQPNGNDQSGFMPDFMTPEQIKAQREWANVLRKNSLNASVGAPVNGKQAASPLSPLVAAVEGAYGAYQNAQANRGDMYSMNAPGKAWGAQGAPNDPGVENGGYAPSPVSYQPQQSSGSDVAWNSPQAIQTAINIESGGNPNAHTGSYSGLFQLSPSEAKKYGGTGYDAGVASWTNTAGQLRNILGREPTGAEVYLAHQQGLGGFQAHMGNPNAPAWQNMLSTAEGQQKGPGWARQAIWGNIPDRMKAQFGSVDNVTSQAFMDMWKGRFNSGHFGGGAPAAGDTPDAGSPQAPLNQFAGPGAPPDATGGGAGQSPMAFAQNDVPPQAMQTAAALRGGGGGGQPPIGNAPAGPATSPPPGQFFQPRPRISPQQLQAIVNSPYSSPEMKAVAIKQFQEQFYPTELEAPFGSGKYIRSPNGGVYFSPGAPKDITTKAGRIETQHPRWIGPDGSVHYLDSGAGPVTQGGKGAGTDLPTPGGFDIDGGDNDISGGKRNPVPEKPHSETEPTGANPAQVAALETGTASDAPAPGVLGTPAPSAGPALANKPPGIQTAQAGGNFAGMSDQQLLELDQKNELATEQAKHDQELYNKSYDRYQNAGQDAKTALPQIQFATKLFARPELIQGPWSTAKQLINDAFTATTGNPNSTTATTLKNTVDKLVASGVLSSLRQTLQGLGQIRLAEIKLLEQASASTYNTPQANAAILFLAQRLSQRASDLGDLTSAYRSGARWDRNGKSIPNKGDLATLAGQNEAINTYMRRHPAMTDEEGDKLSEMLTGGVNRQKRNKPSSDSLPSGLNWK